MSPHQRAEDAIDQHANRKRDDRVVDADALANRGHGIGTPERANVLSNKTCCQQLAVLARCLQIEMIIIINVLVSSTTTACTHHVVAAEVVGPCFYTGGTSEKGHFFGHFAHFGRAWP